MTNVTCHLPLVDLVPLSGDIDHLIERCMGRPMTADEGFHDVMCHLSCAVLHTWHWLQETHLIPHLEALLPDMACVPRQELG